MSSNIMSINQKEWIKARSTLARVKIKKQTQIRYKKQIVQELRFENIDIKNSKQTIHTIHLLIKNNPSLKNKLFHIALRYDIGWFNASRWFDGDSLIKFPITSARDLYSGEFLPDNVLKFSIFYIEKPDTKGGRNKDNLCLFMCLKECFNGKLPRLKKPQLFKKFLNIGYSDPVSYQKLGILEDKLKINIHLSGDYERISTTQYSKDCYLKLENGHYTINERENPRFKELSIFKSSKDRPLIVYNSTNFFNGRELTVNNKKNKMNPRFYCLVSVKDDLDLVEEWNTLNNNFNELKKINPRFNLFQHRGSTKNLSLYLIYQGFKCQRLEPITENEAEYLSYAMSGGLRYGNKTEIKNGFLYDIRSMYPFLLSEKTSMPIKQPTFHRLDILPDNLKFGIYRCSIVSQNNKDDKLFFFKASNYYTHQEINRARELGFTIDLIINEQPNAMIYPNHYVKFNNIKDDIEELYKLKQQGVKMAKSILLNIWGGMCQKDKRIFHTSSHTDIIDCDKLDRIKPEMNGHHLTKYNHTRLFKTDFARMGPFLTSICRCYMSREIEPFKDIIHYINTDGFISSNECNLPTGDKLGDWRLEKQGNFNIEGKRGYNMV